MPYDSYRLYQIQRTKSSAESRRADEQAARIVSALTALFDVITRRRPVAANGRPARWQVLPEQNQAQPQRPGGYGGEDQAVAELIGQARVQRYASMYLETSIRQTEALSLYRSLGFVEVEPYYDTPRPLRDWLVFLRLTRSAEYENNRHYGPHGPPGRAARPPGQPAPDHGPAGQQVRHPAAGIRPAVQAPLRREPHHSATCTSPTSASG